MKVMLAMGVPELEKAIQQKLKNLTYTKSAHFKETIVPVASSHKPDVIVISELLKGNIGFKECVKHVDKSMPEVKLILILLKETDAAYYSKYNVIPPKFSSEDLLKAIEEAV